MPKARVDTWTKYHVDEEWRGNASSNPSSSPAYTTLPRQAYGTQELRTSFGHPYQLLGKGAPGDIGGPFSVVRREYWENVQPQVHNRTVTDDSNVFAYNYRGQYFARDASVTDSSFPAPLIPLSSELIGLGTSAIARVLPTNPISDALVFIGELRSEGIPQLVGAQSWQGRTLRAREAGKEYLNAEFGWRPLLNEILTFNDLVRRRDIYVQRFLQESGKLLHRRYVFPPTITTSKSETATWPNPGLKTGYWNAQGVRTTITRTHEETWFSGAFTYYVPPPSSFGSSVKRNEAIASKLFGTRLTPEVLWNLTPWSWAADWGLNTGDVLHNLSAFRQDGLVMPYGYIMRRRTHVVEESHRGARMKRNNASVITDQRFTTTVKTRYKATPYGFGLNPATFTGRQWAILGALGLARGSGPSMKYD
jgi:hypothetical protein